MSNMLDASHQPNPRPDEYQPDWIPPSSRDPNGTHSLNDRGASPTDAKKLSFKQVCTSPFTSLLDLGAPTDIDVVNPSDTGNSHEQRV